MGSHLYFSIDWTALYSGMHEGDESLGVFVILFCLLFFNSFMSNNNKSKQYIA